MLVRRALAIAAVAAFALATMPEARAGFALDSLVGDVVNHLEDQDFETLINNVGSATVVDVGDYLVGMITISTLKAPPGSTSVSLGGGSTFTGVFLIEVATKGGGGGSPFTFTFKPAPSSAWTAAGVDIVRTDTGTMLVMYEDNVGPPNVMQAGLSLKDALQTAEDGTGLWEFGFTGAMDAAAAGEFWSAESPTDDITMFTGPAGGAPIQDLEFINALNVTTYLSGPLLDKHDELMFGTATDLQSFGVGESISPDDGGMPPLANPLPVFTESDLYIKPNVPEASSIVAWSLLGLVGGWSLKRRARRRAA